MKHKVFLATLVASSLLTSHALAGSYTKSDVTINSSYDRTKAKLYAEQYARTPNSAYYYYGSGNLGGDCTNFISQVLFHGGLPEKKVYASGSHGMSYLAPADYGSWYYDGYDLPNRSRSWTGAHDFRYHWANVNNAGNNRAYKYTVYTMQQAYDNFPEIYRDLWPGDIVQYVYAENGETWHSQVVHKYDTYGNLFVAQHSFNDMDLKLRDRIKGRLDQGDNGWFVTYRIKSTS